MPPKKGYHVYYIARSTYHCAYTRQTQVKWKKEQKNIDDKGKKKEKTSEREKRKEKERNGKKGKKRKEKKRKDKTRQGSEATEGKDNKNVILAYSRN